MSMEFNAREAAIKRMVSEQKITQEKAAYEIKKRIRNIKCIIALHGYYTWSQEQGLLLGGPKLKAKNYSRVQSLIESKCYGVPNDTLYLSVWDLIDLTSPKAFKQYSINLIVPLTLREILLLKLGEWENIKRSRNYLMTQRNRLCV